ncbi:MAG: MATE family efflux transporter [Limnochordia bacterium]|nr:MATE family efflux transporter [Limnochordia bacterium]
MFKDSLGVLQARLNHEDRVLAKDIIRLAGPVVLSNLAGVLLGFTDTFFMGRVSTSALGAVGLASTVYFALFLIPRGIVSAVMPFTARRFGEGDLRGAGCVLWNSLFLVALLLPIGLLLPSVFRLFFRIMEPGAELVQLSLTYCNIRLIEFPAALLTTAIMSFMMGLGDSKTPMFISWSVVLVNVFANYILVFGKAGLRPMGIAGAAWGTVIAQTIGFCLFIAVVLVKYRRKCHVGKRSFPSVKSLGDMIKVGLPIGLADSVEVMAFGVFFALIARLGTNELAGSQIANQLAGLSFMPGFAFGAATGSMVGRWMGAGDLDAAKRSGYIGAALAMATMGISAIVFLVFPRQLVSIFTSDVGVIRVGEQLLRLMAVYQIFDALNIVFRSALNSAGDSVFTGVSIVLASSILFIPGAYIGAFTLGFGLLGAWAGAIMYLVTLGVAFTLRFRNERWVSIQL